MLFIADFSQYINVLNVIESLELNSYRTVTLAGLTKIEILLTS